ncbi:MAG: hypothetical protein DWQ29_12350, partial [Planctomycetota bacterium]
MKNTLRQEIQLFRATASMEGGDRSATRRLFGCGLTEARAGASEGEIDSATAIVVHNLPVKSRVDGRCHGLFVELSTKELRDALRDR